MVPSVPHLGGTNLLRNWRVDNFKSIPAGTEIALAKINVFAGANSSGKSSFLQSILLIKQSMQNLSAQKTVSINGAIVNLGTFDEIKNNNSEDAEFRVGWDFHPSQRVHYRASATSALVDAGPIAAPNRISPRSISADFSWSATPSGSVLEEDAVSIGSLQLQPTLHRGSIHLERHERDPRGSPPVDLLFEQSPESSSEKLGRLGITAQVYPYIRSYLHYDVSLDQVTAKDIIGQRPEAEVVGCGFQHFWPTSFAVRYNEGLYKARRFADTIVSPSRAIGAAYGDFLEDVPHYLLDLVTKWLSERGADKKIVQQINDLREDDFIDTDEVADLIRPLMMTKHGLLQESRAPGYDFSELHGLIEAAVLAQESGSISCEIQHNRSISEAGSLLRDYFVGFVRYLGPLRDEPKAIYQREALAAPTEVGYRGEFTAAVLDLNANRTIVYVSPSWINNPKETPRRSRATLHEAVVEWLSYLGVASAVQTEDQGKLGHRLQVRTEAEGRPYDLTHVGVGVSQVLPILVMALLAPQHSLLIFEQPELHLHPKVQSRLADFFISMSAVNKQTILETHSEYMVERFRLRIAESSSDNVSKDINVYFCDRPHGNTRFRRVEISDYGAIVDWPDDFFDQSQKETERLLLAAAAKRRSRRADQS